MSTEAIVLTVDRTHALSLAARTRRQPLFWIALVCAAIVHAAFIVGLARTSPRTVGDPNGNANAIDVELVDASELQSSGFAAKSGQPPPTPATRPVEPQQPEAAKPEEATPPAKPPELKSTIAPQAEEPQVTALPEPAAGPEPSKSVTKKENVKAEPKPEAKPETKANPQSKPQPKTAKPKPLDLSVPSNLALQSPGADDGPSAATRPPGITRSGENDRFGRDVIRALKKTMPPSYGTRGRVTIRIVLNQRGNIEELRMVQSAGNRDLDGDVLFSAREAVYPFPPKNASVADRTFLVTYVYR